MHALDQAAAFLKERIKEKATILVIATQPGATQPVETQTAPVPAVAAAPEAAPPKVPGFRIHHVYGVAHFAFAEFHAATALVERLRGQGHGDPDIYVESNDGWNGVKLSGDLRHKANDGQPINLALIK